MRPLKINNLELNFVSLSRDTGHCRTFRFTQARARSIAAEASPFCLDAKSTKTERSELMSAFKKINKTRITSRQKKASALQAIHLQRSPSDRPAFLSGHCALLVCSLYSSWIFCFFFSRSASGEIGQNNGDRVRRK